MRIAIIPIFILISQFGFSQQYYHPVKAKSKKDSLIEIWVKKQKQTYTQGKYTESVLYFDSLLEQQGIQISYFSLRIAIYSCRKAHQKRDFSFGEDIFGKQLMKEAWHPLNMKGNEKLYEVVDEPPIPKGGMKKFQRYLSSNLNYPQQAIENEIEGQVYVRFVINKDGSVDGVCVLKGLSMECNIEAERLIKEGPDWKPAEKNGLPVYLKMVYPISFSL